MFVSPDSVSRLQEGVGEDWWKIKHVKSIIMTPKPILEEDEEEEDEEGLEEN